MTRPSSKKQCITEKECQKYYELGKSAGYAAQKIGVHRHTAEKYYKQFNSIETEENEETFKKAAIAQKQIALAQIDNIEDKVQAQIKRQEGIVGDDETGMTAERVLQKSLMDALHIVELKSAIVLTPTMQLRFTQELARVSESVSKTVEQHKQSSSESSTKG